MDKTPDLTRTWFIGKVLPDLDPKNQRRYRVHLPLLLPHLEEDRGIWCKNHSSPCPPTPSDVGESCGGYTPLQPGMFVRVGFQENDLNTGYINNVISDQRPNSATTGQGQNAVQDTKNRDREHIHHRSPMTGNSSITTEQTATSDDPHCNEPNAKIDIYNNRRTVSVQSEQGEHKYTQNNKFTRIGQDKNEQVDANKTGYVMGDKKTNVDGTCDRAYNKGLFTTCNGNEERYIVKEMRIFCEAHIHVSTNDSYMLWADKDIGIDSEKAFIHLNNRVAFMDMAQGSAQKTEVKDLGQGATKESGTGVGYADDRAPRAAKGPKDDAPVKNANPKNKPTKTETSTSEAPKDPIGPRDNYKVMVNDEETKKKTKPEVAQEKPPVSTPDPTQQKYYVDPETRVVWAKQGGE